MARYTYTPNRVIDSDGISDGASIYFYATGTTTPITIYSDEALSTEISNPVVVAAGAAVPAVYYAQAEIRVRVVDSGGAVVSDDDPYDNLKNDLASSTAGKGAALVNFLQSGTGAVSRTVQAKLRDEVSVKDFGAAGDNATNDTAAIQAAIDAVSAAGGGTVYFPRGTYLCAGLTITSSGVELRGATKSSSILKANAASDLLTFDSSGGEVNDCGVRDLGFDPNGQVVSGLVISGANANDFHVFERLEFIGAGNDTGFSRAVKITGRMIWCRFQDIDIRYDRDSGFWCETSSAVNLNTFINVRVWRSQYHGFYFKNTSGSTYFHSNNFYSCNPEFNGVDTTGAKNSGFYFYDVGETVISGAYVEDNGVGSADGLDAAVRTEGSFGGITIEGGIFWGSDYGFKLDATLGWGNIAGPRVACTTKNIEINATNSTSSFTVQSFYESTTPTGGRGIGAPLNVNSDSFVASLIPLKMPVWAEQSASQDLSQKSLLRFTNGSPVSIADTDLTNAAPGHILWIVNDGGSTVTLTHGSNLNVPGSASLVLATGQSAMLAKVTATKWWVLYWTHQQSSAYTPSNVTTDRSFDADTVAVAELADVVGTLIADLQAAKILR